MRRTLLLLGLIAILVMVKEQFGGKPAIVPKVKTKLARTGDAAPVLKTDFAVAPKSELSNEKPASLVLARLKEWDDNDDPALREERLRNLAALLNGTNALDIIQSLPPEFMGYVFALPSLRERLMSNPQGTMNWMSQHTNVQSQLSTVLHDWGQKNSDEMQQYMGSLPDGEWKQKVLSSAADETLSTDPVAALTYATQMDPGTKQTSLLTMGVAEWAKQDPDAAAQWVDEINDSFLRQLLVASMAGGVASSDPLQAASYAIQHLPSGETLNESIANIVWTWAMQNPGAAGDWLSQFPDDKTKQAGLESLMNVWGNHDEAAATAWVEELPQNSFQTQAAKDLIAVLPSNPALP